jgi:hypothetical protein
LLLAQDVIQFSRQFKKWQAKDGHLGMIGDVRELGWW